ncbi:efflux RND transporter periplasmic adaptor subunit [Methyloligella sp. 2.7D]|uniref:efflux RND transporter periplasmic adaptor subunit n=1 Tax=unclassified Methyloligella TaxID=2625955 RepID=UPI00157C91E8|nr:efflux RND transporter periplasmic adaptor subunit [Methyloligella sp. GL2]QKP78398.1 efflux RND transporter periplasmic adaptor subunit [Methyloligella sp. GL2]
MATVSAQAQSADAATNPSGVQAALSVLVAPVAQSSIENKLTATGSVVAWREMPIGSEASGLAVTAVDVDEGDRVQKGDRLVKLDDRLLQAQIAQQKAAIEKAEATLANAKTDLQRADKMTKGILSEQTIDERATLVKTSAADLAEAKALLAQYEAELARTEILAPTDAIVAERSVTLGQVVESGTELFRLIRDGRLELDAEIPEADFASIRPGQSATVIGPSGARYPATVRQAAEIVDETTRLGVVHVALPEDTPLKIGMFARVEIDAGNEIATTVPQKALVWRGGKAGAFVLQDDGTVAFAALSLGRQTSDQVAVEDGLSPGQRIVVSGAGLLNEGDPVRAETASAALPSEIVR